MKTRVAIGPSSFGEVNKAPIKMLEDAGIEIIENPFKRRLTELEVLNHLKNVDGLLAGLEPLTRNVLKTVNGKLKVIARVGIGMSNVDIDAARQMGIKVSNTPDGPTEAVSEMTLAALLNCARKIAPMSHSLRAGEWNKMIGMSLSEMTVMIIGYGRIGRSVANLLSLFNTKILVYDPYLTVLENNIAGIKLVNLNEGIKRADCITLHASGDKVLLGKKEFNYMKPGMILLNSARGELVDEEALVNAIEKQIVTSCWFDAFCDEPYTGLLTKYNEAILTPHSSTYTRKCRYEMEMQAVRNLLVDLNECNKQ